MYLTTLSGAVIYGDYLVKCELIPGTQILWHSEPDPKVIKFLIREFGRGILSPDFWKALPTNKQLKKREVAELFHYMIRETYLKTWRNRMKRSDLFSRNFSRIYSQLKLHGFDGICIDWPEGGPELVLFNPSQVKALSFHTWSLRPTTDTDQFWDSPYDDAIILSKPIGLKSLKEIQDKGREEDRLDEEEIGEI
ncbi:hypothetical protein ACFL03_06570 [Thermodesulfobacteriota bacterium]